MTTRFQFSLRTLLVAMLVVAAFFGGLAVQRQLDKPFTVIEKNGLGWHTRIHGGCQETMTLRDGTVWTRYAEH